MLSIGESQPITYQSWYFHSSYCKSSSIRMTENYAKLFDKTGIEEMKSKLFDKPKNEKGKIPISRMVNND